MAEVSSAVNATRRWVSSAPISTSVVSSSLDDVSSGLQGPDAKEETQNLTRRDSCAGQRLSSQVGLTERMASRAGFSAPKLDTSSVHSSGFSLNAQFQSPYLTIPPGLSPTALLESPVFVSNTLAHPSPTTGKLSCIPTENKASTCEPASFTFKPVGDSSFSLDRSIMVTQAYPFVSFPPAQLTFQTQSSVSSHGVEMANAPFQLGSNTSIPEELSIETTENDDSNALAEERVAETVHGGSGENSPLSMQEDGGDQVVVGECVTSGSGGGGVSDDGYNWRKYGQKQVKGSEYPRSYYKCTQQNCSVKKKVERSHEGHITEIIYKGAHNHPRPSVIRRLPVPNSISAADILMGHSARNGYLNGSPDNDSTWLMGQSRTVNCDDHESSSPHTMHMEADNQLSYIHSDTAPHGIASEVLDASSTFCNNVDDDDRTTRGSTGYGIDEDESESRRRKLESYGVEMSGATRAIREPRVVVQTTSEVDILDDGYRWRKYGQKVVKGNPNPRSYYKCTSAGCTVRKHVERASHDLKSVITTYEGKHNHDVPVSKHSSHVSSSFSMPLPLSMVRADVDKFSQSQLMGCTTSVQIGSFMHPTAAQLVGPPSYMSYRMTPPPAVSNCGPSFPFLPQQFPSLPKEGGNHELGPALTVPSDPYGCYSGLMSRLPFDPHV